VPPVSFCWLRRGRSALEASAGFDEDGAVVDDGGDHDDGECGGEALRAKKELAGDYRLGRSLRPVVSLVAPLGQTRKRAC
jgi:hypothetical protein